MRDKENRLDIKDNGNVQALVPFTQAVEAVFDLPVRLRTRNIWFTTSDDVDFTIHPEDTAQTIQTKYENVRRVMGRDRTPS